MMERIEVKAEFYSKYELKCGKPLLDLRSVWYDYSELMLPQFSLMKTQPMDIHENNSKFSNWPILRNEPKWFEARFDGHCSEISNIYFPPDVTLRSMNIVWIVKCPIVGIMVSHFSALKLFYSRISKWIKNISMKFTRILQINTEMLKIRFCLASTCGYTCYVSMKRKIV